MNLAHARQVALGIALLVPPASAAQEPSPAGQRAPERFFDWTQPDFTAEEYARRRAALFEALGAPSGVVLIPSAHGLGHGETFRQSDDFHYLTGLELPGSALVLDVASRAVVLFAPETDFRFENPGRPNDFPGRPLADDPELARRSGIADVRPMSDLTQAIEDWHRRTVPVYVNAGRRGQIRPVVTSLIPDWDPLLLSLYHLQATYPRLDLRNAYDALARVRMVKSEAELVIMRRAARATMGAMRASIRDLRDGVSERELEASFEAACKRNGAARLAFASIIKSGPNSLWPWRILSSSYDRRNRAMHDGELVIYDVGCEVRHYVSDVGRTFPVSGRFTDAQREILRMEVAVADAIIAAVRPGVTFAELQEVADAAIPAAHRRFMQTGLFFGHHLGLDTGDPNLPDLPLEPGMVFTVEPWYYNHESALSVFTEDEILVTETGAEVLTRGLPRTPEALERLVNANPDDPEER